jgi:8-oxo-(d)GTP phosphatase
MRLFIHDTPIRLISSFDRSKLAGYRYDSLLFKPKALFDEQGEVFVEGFTPQETAQILIQYFSYEPAIKPLSITWVVSDLAAVKALLKSHFTYLEAAGGLVRKDNSYLLIFRLNRWDLPKGKIEKNEKAKKAAEREIQEECGVEATVQQKICTTWHTYHFKGRPMLKKTYWYMLSCGHVTNLTPQKEENITDAVWCDYTTTAHWLATSYPSIQRVWEKAKKKIKEPEKVNNL